MGAVSMINEILEVCGIQIKKYPSLDFRRRISLIKSYKINKVFDIGANIGIYGLELKKLGYSGEIVSFEPLTQAFKVLSKKASKYDNWKIQNCALGEFDGKAIINISKNSVSSSILEMLPLHYENEKNAKFIDTETIRICKLDTVFKDYYRNGDRVFLKIDTQGYEKNVLDGARESLPEIAGLQIELSSVALYKRSPLYLEMIEYIYSLGFSLYSIENGFYEAKSGRLLQFDCFFFREDRLIN